MALKSALVVFLLSMIQASIAAKILAQNTQARSIKPDFNVTTKTDDYAIQNKRQYLAIIKTLSDELNAYKSNYAQQLEIINTQSELLEVNMLNIEQHLIPLEMLNDASKYCVQKYKTSLPSVFSTTNKIMSCTSSAQSSYTNIVSSAQTVITNMNSFISNQFKAGLDNCIKLHGNTQFEYTLCVTKAVAIADSNMVSFRNSFKTQMLQNTCAGNNRVKLAVECSFANVYSAIYTSGEVMNLINNCIDGKEFCPICPLAAPTNQTPTSGCPNVINLQMSPEIYTNNTITNPFHGLKDESGCVEVQFQQNETSDTLHI